MKGEILSIIILLTVSKISSITDLLTPTLTAVENKIPDDAHLVKKTDYNTKISEIEIQLLLIMIMINILLLNNLMS